MFNDHTTEAAGGQPQGQGYEDGIYPEDEYQRAEAGGLTASQQVKLMEALVETSGTPDEVEDAMQGPLGLFMNKEFALTFLSGEDVNSILRSFDDTITADMMMKFPHEYSADTETSVTAMRSAVAAKARRSEGRGNQNERTLQATQIQQAVIDEPERPSGGIISRSVGAVKSAFGGGGGR